MRLLFFLLVLLNTFCTMAQVEATFMDNRVEITWNYFDVKTVNYYVIEKSKNGKSFRELIKVPNRNNYNSSFLETDQNPSGSMSFYRIRYVNHNNDYFYSETIVVKFLQTEKSLNKNLKGFNGINQLVILRDKSNNEYYAKLNIREINGVLISKTLNEKLKSGTYQIISSENDDVVGLSLKIINQATNNSNDYNK